MPVGREEAGGCPGAGGESGPACPAGGCRAGEDPRVCVCGGAPPLPPKMSGSRGNVGEKAGEKAPAASAGPVLPARLLAEGGFGKENPGNFLFCLPDTFLKWHATRRRSEKRKKSFKSLTSLRLRPHLHPSPLPFPRPSRFSEMFYLNKVLAKVVRLEVKCNEPFIPSIFVE